jgi:hypothetical protein
MPPEADHRNERIDAVVARHGVLTEHRIPVHPSAAFVVYETPNQKIAKSWFGVITSQKSTSWVSLFSCLKTVVFVFGVAWGGEAALTDQ